METDYTFELEGRWTAYEVDRKDVLNNNDYSYYIYAVAYDERGKAVMVYVGTLADVQEKLKSGVAIVIRESVGRGKGSLEKRMKALRDFSDHEKSTLTWRVGMAIRRGVNLL